MKISKILTKQLILHNFLDTKNEDIYTFGFFILINYLTMLLMTMVFSYYLKLNSELYIFLFSIMLLRSYTGGFHFESYYKCLIVSILELYFIGTLLIQSSKDLDLLFYFSYIVGILLMVLSPIDTVNRRLSTIEKNIIKRKVILILFVELFILFFVNKFRFFRILIYPYFLSLLHCLILLIFGIIDNKLRK